MLYALLIVVVLILERGIVIIILPVKRLLRLIISVQVVRVWPPGGKSRLLVIVIVITSWRIVWLSVTPLLLIVIVRSITRGWCVILYQSPVIREKS